MRIPATLSCERTCTGSLPDSDFATYVVVSDADVIYARAKTAGAEIEREIKDED